MSANVIAPRVLGGIGVFFGVMTVIAGGSVVFDLGTARADHGQYVPFVLWFNFLAGFVYVAAGVGLVRLRAWAAPLAAAIAAGTAIVGFALGAHVAMGGAFERETVVAMGVRFVLWSGLAAYSCRRFGCRSGVVAGA